MKFFAGLIVLSGLFFQLPKASADLIWLPDNRDESPIRFSSDLRTKVKFGVDPTLSPDDKNYHERFSQKGNTYSSERAVDGKPAITLTLQKDTDHVEQALLVNRSKSSIYGSSAVETMVRLYSFDSQKKLQRIVECNFGFCVEVTPQSCDRQKSLAEKNPGMERLIETKHSFKEELLPFCFVPSAEDQKTILAQASDFSFATMKDQTNYLNSFDHQIRIQSVMKSYCNKLQVRTPTGKTPTNGPVQGNGSTI